MDAAQGGGELFMSCLPIGYLLVISIVNDSSSVAVVNFDSTDAIRNM